jgi:hypothetical protein
MSSVASKAKWTGKLLLHLPGYMVLSYCCARLIGGAFTLLIKAGATLPPQLLLQHFLVVNFAAGLLAGILGIELFRAMVLLPFRPKMVSVTGWKNPKAWTWIIPTLVLAVEIASWVRAQRSVLASSGVSFSSFFAVFFGDACNLQYGPSEACLTQVSYTHAWLGTLGYSASAFLPQIGQPKDSDQEVKLEQSELNPELSSRPGETLQ